MKSHLDSLLESELELKNGVGFLLPAKWWKQFRDSNQQITTIDQLVCPPLSLDQFVDSFLLQFEQGILAELQHKSNYLKFHKVFLSPQPHQNVEWVCVSSDMWRIISNKIKPRFSLITLYDDKNPTGISIQNTIQVQVIFCSKTKSDVFVGFLPDKADAISAIRNIGFQLGFVQMNNSRIIFPDKNRDKPYYFCELESITFADSQDTIFLAYNMECAEQKDEKNNPLNFSFGKEDEMGNSNEAMAGDLGAIGIQSFDQVRNDGTMSTGAETPSFFGSEEENMREFRVRELFRQKKPEQIEELRSKAKKIVNGKLIPIAERCEKELNQQLEGIIQDLYEHISLHKKKSYKQKQYHQ